MKFTFFLLLVCLLLPTDSNGIVIRHDQPAQAYIVSTIPDYLIDMPHEGHGVLFHPQWIVTVAHEIFYDYTGKTINISGKNHIIEKVVLHPKYQKIPKFLFKGKSLPLMAFNKNNHDIALIKLSKPVANIEPIKLYNQSDELTKKITIYGKGATGNGKAGQVLETKKDKIPRFCTNKISNVKDQWISYRFDDSTSGLPLEGMHGSGDSGGPSVIHIDNNAFLVGLSAWQFIDGEMGQLTEGLYGTIAYQVRISYYVRWIEGVIEKNQ